MNENISTSPNTHSDNSTPAPTRRDFLKTSALLATLTAMPALSFGASNASGARDTAGASSATASTPGAPPRGLLFGDSDMKRIRANLDHPRCAFLRKELLEGDAAADLAFIKTARTNNHVYDQSKVRLIIERRSLAYVLTGDTAHADLARTAMEKLFEFPKWDYFLDGGTKVVGIQRASESTIAVIFALDWLGDKLTPEFRAEAEKQVAEKGAPACFTMLYGCKYPDRSKGWAIDPEENFPIDMDLSRWPQILATNNLRTIPLAALGIAACWLHGRHPQADAWLNMARDSARSFSVAVNADGSYDEGVGYWGYTALHLVLFAEVLWRTRGIDDRSLVNYPGMARFALAMASPTLATPVPADAPTKGTVVMEASNDFVNFCDSGVAMDVAVMPWIARTHDSALAQHVAMQTGALRSPFALIWFEPKRRATAPARDLLDTRLANDWIISRTGWKTSDSVVAFRSGGPVNHEHADRNSIIFKAHGERLLHDQFRAGYDPKQPRWNLRLTSAHTAMLIDGKGHQYHNGREGTNSAHGWAYVKSYRTGDNFMITRSDATEAYALVDDNTALVERTVVFLKPEVLLILDRVKFKKSAKPVQLRYQVYNDDLNGRVSIGSGNTNKSGDTFEIIRPNATLLAQVYSVANEKISIAQGLLDLPPTDGVCPFAEATSASALEHTLLTICTAAPKDTAHGSLSAKPTAPGIWRITGSHRGRAIDITLGDGDPKITA